MSDVEQAILTAALTLLGGTLLFIFGEFAKVLVIAPLQKFKEQVQLTLDRIDFHARYVTNFFSEEPDDEELELIRQISADFRSAATQLRSKYAGVGARKLLIRVRIVPSTETMKEVYGSLMLLSNNIPREGRGSTNKEIDPIMTNHDAMERVKAALTH